MSDVAAAGRLTRRPGTKRDVTEISFTVRAGEVFGFLEPNGAGKPATIRLLPGLYRPTSGSKRVLGADPTRDAVEIHRRAGYLTGELALFPRLTGRQHLDRFARLRGLHDRSYADERQRSLVTGYPGSAARSSRSRRHLRPYAYGALSASDRRRPDAAFVTDITERN